MTKHLLQLGCIAVLMVAIRADGYIRAAAIGLFVPLMAEYVCVIVAARMAK